MGLGGAGWVKNFSVGICDGAPSTAHSSMILLLSSFVQIDSLSKNLTEISE